MRSLCLFFILPILVQCSATTLKQERATVHRCNTKYVEECHTITRRLKRAEPYKTNLTTVSRYQWDNNVTYVVVLLHSGFPVELVRVKLCDLQSITWVAEYVKLYSNLVGECPFKPGPLGLYNIELPPKNLPQTILNLLNGSSKSHLSMFIVVTATEEIILEYALTLVG